VDGSIRVSPAKPVHKQKAHSSIGKRLGGAIQVEAALLLARSPDPTAARPEIGAAVDRLFGGLRRSA
jgi:hypothetical protein